MKSKIRYYRCATLMTSLFLCGCQREAQSPVTPAPTEMVTRIEAVISDGDTRTSLNDTTGKVVWTPSDSISVFTASGIRAKFVTEEGGAKAEFTGEIEPSESFHGLYPYSEAATFSSGTFTTTLPAEQSVPDTVHSYDPSAFISVGSSTTTEMPFINVCGGIRISLSESGITRMVLRSRGGEILSGTVNVTAGETPSGSFTAASSADSISLTCTSGSFSTTGGYYYFTTLPQRLTKGFTLTFYKGETFHKSTVCHSPVTISRGTFGTISNADDQSSLDRIFDGEDLSAGGTNTANCYIVSSEGYYKFPAVTGNGSSSVGTVDSVRVLWETDNTANTIAGGSVISRLTFKKGYVHFCTSEPIKNGNALIAAYGSYGTILWSWHIWVCSGYDPEGTKVTLQGKSGILMDRNIGALSATQSDPLSFGMMYQWGRKDPFVGFASYSGTQLMYSTSKADTVRTDENVGTIAYVMAHPNTYLTCPKSYQVSQIWYWDTNPAPNSLWGASKTIYDPCPAGWKVPSGDIQSGENQWKGVNYQFVTGGVNFTTSSGGSSWYPMNGTIYSDGTYSWAADKNYGRYGEYWTYTPTGTLLARTMILDNRSDAKSVNPASTNQARAAGHSVRCIKE